LGCVIIFLTYLNYVIRCLAHIINLATQALISTRSKSKYYNPHDLEEHVPDVDAFERDEMGLVRAIAVKVSRFLILL
jgi:Na+-transporting methylmalonyl-CoA/oxaloacetate decarboxylase gamma subunit